MTPPPPPAEDDVARPALPGAPGPVDDGFAALARLARQAGGWDTAVVRFLDGQPGATAGPVREGPRLDALCRHTVLAPGLFAVRDADIEAGLTAEHASDRHGWPRAWAGVPIVVDGCRMGVVACAAATPRPAGPALGALLHDLAGVAAALASARVRAEGEARRTDERVHGARSRFLSRMSHEMRTPLNAVLGFSQLMLGGAPGIDEMKSYAGQVLRAGRQLLDMTNDVLELQRVEEGELVLQPVEIELDAAMRRVAEALAAAAAHHGVQLRHELPPGLRVLADAERLHRVLLQVTSNAVKYNRPGGSVCWSAARADARVVRLVVEDTGRGLHPAELRRLFEPFERLGRETSAIEGTGLGLLVARGLAQAMGGTLQVESTPGVGTRVVLELPAAAAVRTGGAAEDALGAAGDAALPGVLRLLYVEDNAVNAMLFVAALGMADGIELRIATDGEDALAQVAHWTPDVLVLDAHLPGMDGYALLAALRRRPGIAEVPAFMCSADALPEDLARATEAGFAGYWAKPIDIPRILRDLEVVRERLAPRRPPA